MTEQDAIAALKEMGIKPSSQLIENWLRAADAEQGLIETVDNKPLPSELATASAKPEPSTPPHSSKSCLQPVLREAGQLERWPGPRRPGRPRVIASWFPKVAEAMADGTSLKTALALNGITNLSKSEVRACYRNKTLQALYQEARRKFLAENYGRKPTLRAKLGRYL